VKEIAAGFQYASEVLVRLMGRKYRPTMLTVTIH
jgi:hypothetical protein